MQKFMKTVEQLFEDRPNIRAANYDETLSSARKALTEEEDLEIRVSLANGYTQLLLLHCSLETERVGEDSPMWVNTFGGFLKAKANKMVSFLTEYGINPAS